jgi:glycosyltransferase involved in cell wall biosynthesis
LVSVVIPVFNGQDYLGATLASVACQTLSDLEIVIIDDGSTDATAELVSSASDRRLRYLRQQRSGAAAARNFGVQQAAGKLIAFLDADDLWLPEKLAQQVAALDAGRGDVIFTKVEEFLSPDLSAAEASEVRLKQGALNGLSASTCLVSRADFDRVGPLDTGLQIAEFIDWYSRAEELGLRPHVVPEVLARRRVHRRNQTRLNREARSEYSFVAKRTLDRRRAMRQQSG